MLKYLSKPAIIAHRGASAYAPENTLAAYELAVRQKADAIEMDAKLTRDGHVVLFHDQTLLRTTGMPGRVINSTLADLRRLDAGSFFDVAYRGEPIPTLEEVLSAIGHQIIVFIELTNYASLTDDLPTQVAEIVVQQGMADRVIFSSFNPIALIRMRKILPEVPQGLLAQIGWKGALARSWLGMVLRYQALILSINDIHRKLVQNTHQRGCAIMVHTVNKPDEMRRFIKMGVDGIITDDPLTALNVLSTGTRRYSKDMER